MKIFVEEQKFNQWWMYSIIGLSVIGGLMPFFLEKNQLYNNTEMIFWLLVIVISLLLSIYFVFSIKLETKINETGVHYKLFPLQRTFQTIKWSEMNSCTVEKYSPLKDYGGYGWRIGFAGKGKALNIRGNMGIKIVLKTNKKILLGTQKPDIAKNTIETYRDKIDSA